MEADHWKTTSLTSNLELGAQITHFVRSDTGSSPWPFVKLDDQPIRIRVWEDEPIIKRRRITAPTPHAF